MTADSAQPLIKAAAESDNGLREWLARQFTNNAATIAVNLREVADQIERNAAQIARVPSPGLDNAGNLAARIVNDVTATVAANLSSIVSAAARYDHETKES